MNLSESEQRIYDELRGNGDVPISTLFRAATRKRPTRGLTPQQQQQRIGPYLTRLKRKLQPLNIGVVPGILRRTYRLVRLDD